MAEPRIQYVTAPDGVSIAYADIGEGYPVIYMSGMPWNHIQLQWQMPQYRAWFENVFLRRRMIQFDARGSGLSDRNPTDISLEAFVSDIEAVADRVGLEKFAIAAVQASVMPAVACAVKDPERVTHLYLWDPVTDGPAFMELPQVKAFFSMLEFDWGMFTSTIARATGGWDNPESGLFENFVRESMNQRDAQHFYFDFVAHANVMPLLPRIAQHTLVAQHKGNPFPPSETGRQVASRIRNSELLMLDGTWRDYEANIPIINAALDRLLGPPTTPREPPPRTVAAAKQDKPAGGLVTILFTDIEGSTALTQRLGDERARDLFREHERITRDALREFGGSEVKSMGDGFMASFVSATQALGCAIAMERAFAAHNEASESQLNIRIGLNTGEPIAEEEDLFGTAVITAARIAGHAKGGEILASNVVRELVAGRGFAFADRGEMVLRGFDDPVRVFELRWREVMAEPRIQYATTSDGVSIAYFSMGEGPPLVITPPIPWSHLQMQLDDPGYRAWYERMARTSRIICYDNRGSGLSDRKVADLTFEALELDILAVADKLGVEKFALLGISIGSPPAITLTARHPERISRLLLWCGFASADPTNPQAQALNALLEADWNMYTETIAHATAAGWGSSDEAGRFAKLMRAAVDPETVRQIGFLSGFDINYLLPDIRCPVLVLHRQQAMLPDMEGARRLAAALPDAQLLVLDGGALLPWVGDMEAVVTAVEDFLGLATPASEPPPAVALKAAPGGMVTILFTDIEGSTTMTQHVGDAAAQTVVRAHNTVVRDALREHGGTETKHTGDGIMASFPLASSAIEAAIAIQRAVAAHSEAHPETAFRVRIGLNAGEPVVEEQDMFGTAVQLARRVCDQAEAGSILVTDVVRQLAAGKRYLFSDTGEATLRGFEDPVRLYEVSWK